MSISAGLLTVIQEYREVLTEYRQPVFTVELGAAETGVTPTNLYREVNALQEEGVIVQSVEHRGPMLYRSPEVLAAIDALAERAGRRSLS